MCYNASYLTLKALKYALRDNVNPKEIERLTKLYRQLKQAEEEVYHVNAFAHPKIPVITNEESDRPQLFKWGLIPSWVKTKKDAINLSRKTLNARGETIFEKPSFGVSAKSKRCIVILDGFYEYHHHKGKKYPFYIRLKSENPMAVAGLWDEWIDSETGEVIRTVTIITTVGNERMSLIHNNPKLSGPRMPVILPDGVEQEWIVNENVSKDLVEHLLAPYPDDLLIDHPVGQLLGKNKIGNVKEAHKKKEYEELEI